MSASDDAALPLDEKLRLLRERKAELIGKLDSDGQATNASVKVFETDTANAIESVKKDVDGISTYFTSKSTKVTSRLSTINEDVKNSLSEATKATKLYVWSIRIVWTMFCGLLFYIVYLFYLLGVIPVALLFVLGVAVNELYIKSRRTITDSDTERVATSIDTLRQGVEDATANAPKSTTDFSLVRRVSRSIKAGVVQITTTVGTLSSTITKLTEVEDLFTRQKRLIESFQYTLRRYQFKESPDLTLGFQNYTSVSVNDDIWVDDLVKLVSETSGRSEKIIRLIFYDSTYRKADTDATWLEITKQRKATNENGISASEQLANNHEIAPDARIEGDGIGIAEGHGLTSLIGELAALLVENGLVIAPEERDAKAALSKLLLDMDIYSFELATARANAFFLDLASFKIDCIGHLKYYDLGFKQREDELKKFMPLAPTVSSEQMEDELKKFMPPTPSTKAWRGEVLSEIAKILDVDSDYVNLLVSESIGDYTSGVSAWKRIVEGEKVAPFAKILVKNRIIKTGIESDYETAVGRLKIVLESNRDKFSLRDVGVDLARVESEILRVRRSIFLCANMFSIKIDYVMFAYTFIPTHTNSVEKDLIGHATNELKQDPQIFGMLYATAIGSPEADVVFQGLHSGKLNLLGDFLIAHKLLPDVPFSVNVAQLLGLYKSFNLQEISTAFDYYHRLSSLSRSLQIFVGENGLATSENALTFQDVIRICPVDRRTSYANGVIALLSELVTRDSETKDLATTNHFEMATAAAALFLHVQGDQAEEQVCHDLYWMKHGSRVLYEYANLSDASSLSKEKPTLYAASLASVTPLKNDVDYRSFVEALKNGVLHVKVSYLLTKQIEEVRVILEKVEARGFEAQKIAANLKEAVRDVLNKDIDTDTIRHFLVTQVLSAYIVTVPGISKVIQLLDNYLEKAADALAKDTGKTEAERQKFSNLIIMRKGSGGSGNWTRIGLIPYGMTFEAFSGYFQETVDKAKEIYKEDHPGSERFTHYLIRVFPTPDALKVISEDPTRKTSPLTIVRHLVDTKMPLSDAVRLMSMAQSGEQMSAKVRTVIEKIIDSDKSSMRALLGAPLIPLLVQFAALKDSFDTRTLDNALFAAYGVGKLSSLATSVAESSAKEGKEAAFASFRKHVEDAMPSGLVLDPNNAELLSNLIYTSLQNVAIVLTI